MGLLPAQLRIGPVVYTVEVSADKMGAHQAERTTDDWAYAWHNRLEVVIDPALTEALRPEVLMHELLHCVLRVSGLAHEFDGLDKQEKLVSKLSPWLLDTLQRNPALVAYLMQAAG